MKTILEWTEISHSAKNIDIDGVLLCLMTFDYLNSELNIIAERENITYYMKHLATDPCVLFRSELADEEFDDSDDFDDDEFEDDFDEDDFEDDEDEFDDFEDDEDDEDFEDFEDEDEDEDEA